MIGRRSFIKGIAPILPFGAFLIESGGIAVISGERNDRTGRFK